MDILIHDTVSKEGKELLTQIGNACKQGEYFQRLWNKPAFSLIM